MNTFDIFTLCTLVFSIGLTCGAGSGNKDQEACLGFGFVLCLVSMSVGLTRIFTLLSQ